MIMSYSGFGSIIGGSADGVYTTPVTYTLIDPKGKPAPVGLPARVFQDDAIKTPVVKIVAGPRGSTLPGAELYIPRGGMVKGSPPITLGTFPILAQPKPGMSFPAKGLALRTAAPATLPKAPAPAPAPTIPKAPFPPPAPTVPKAPAPTAPSNMLTSIVPVGPQYKVGDRLPDGSVVVSITGGTPPTPTAPPASPVATVMKPAISPPILGPALPSAPPAIPLGVDTGKKTVVDLPGAGPTTLKVVEAPVSKPEIISPTPGAAPVMVVPAGIRMVPTAPPSTPAPTAQPEQAVTLPPPLPTRVMPKVAPLLVQEDDSGLPPGVYDAEEFFPSHIPPRRFPTPAEKQAERTRKARMMVGDEELETDMVLTAAGVYDMEGRPYPAVAPMRILPTAAPSKSGIVPTVDRTPKALPAQAQTTGQVVVQGPAKAQAQAKATAATAAPVATVAKPGGTPQKGGILGLLAVGAGGGFLVAGPVGAGVGAVAAFILGGKKS